MNMPGTLATLDWFAHAIDLVDGVVYTQVRGVISVEPPLECMIPPYASWISADDLESLIHACRADDRCEAAVFLIDSPGGESLAMPRVIDALDALAAEKLTVGVAAESALSAMQWMIARCGLVWAASELSRFGSIGTIFSVLDNSRHLEANGFAFEHYTDAEMKAIARDGVQADERQRAEFMRQVSIISGLFRRHMLESRGLGEDIIESLDGRIVYAQEAVAMGLADAIVPRMQIHERVVQTLQTLDSGAENAARSAAPNHAPIV